MSGFVAEMTVFLGSFEEFEAATIVSVVGILLAAGYITWTVQRVFFGEKNPRWTSLPDANNWWETVPMAALVIVIIGVGVYPAIVVDVLDTGIINIVGALK
jgi:NADH-quinone oxidoreductase subunit M